MTLISKRRHLLPVASGHDQRGRRRRVRLDRVRRVPDDDVEEDEGERRQQRHQGGFQGLRSRRRRIHLAGRARTGETRLPRQVEMIFHRLQWLYKL